LKYDVAGFQRNQYLSDSTIVVGGIFLPVSTPENAVQLAAQVPFHKLRGQVLGANVWDNPKVINEGKTTVQGICFSAGQKIDNESGELGRFVENYKKKYGVEPNLLVAPLVVDAINLMLQAYSRGGTSPDELSKNLSNINAYQGLSSEISLNGSDGVNTSAVIMKISGQKTIRVK
jgi:branched-chain amino acid transport system substrate-binding protein